MSYLARVVRPRHTSVHDTAMKRPLYPVFVRLIAVGDQQKIEVTPRNRCIMSPIVTESSATKGEIWNRYPRRRKRGMGSAYTHPKVQVDGCWCDIPRRRRDGKSKKGPRPPCQGGTRCAAHLPKVTEVPGARTVDNNTSARSHSETQHKNLARWSDDHGENTFASIQQEDPATSQRPRAWTCDLDETS